MRTDARDVRLCRASERAPLPLQIVSILSLSRSLSHCWYLVLISRTVAPLPCLYDILSHKTQPNVRNAYTNLPPSRIRPVPSVAGVWGTRYTALKPFISEQMLGRLSLVAACSCLVHACTASLPEWSKNAPLRHAEEQPGHHREETDHVELPMTLLWRRKPVAPVVLIAVMMALVSLCMLGCACRALIGARISLVEGIKADGKAADEPSMLETLPLSPSRGHTPRGQRISRELFVDLPTRREPPKSHAVSICDSPTRLPTPRRLDL